MADDYTTLNPGSGGSSIDEEGVTYGSAPTTRKRSRVVIGGAAAAEIARVENVDAALTDYGLVVRPVRHEIVKSAGNSSVAAIAPAGNFTGTGEDVTAYQGITVNMWAAPAKAQGTLFVEFSPDNTNWDVSIPLTVSDVSVVIPIPLRVVLGFFRVRFVNGTTNLTAVRITTLYHLSAGETLTRTPTQIVGPEEPVKVVRAMVEPGLNHGARTAMAADKTIHGASIDAERITQESADFTDALASNDVTATTTGTGGTATVANGLLTVATSTGVLGATSKVASTLSLVAEPSKEMWADFDAAFTTPTAATEDQRAGVYDASNGYFLGYHGTAFGFTQRVGGVDTFTALTAGNGDPVDGSFLSRFSRGGVLEALDPTKLNNYRIRFYGIEASPITFEVLSPDGNWMVMHTIRPNNSATAAPIQNADLPFAYEVSKVATDATNLQIKSSGYSAGKISAVAGLIPSDLFSRAHVDANVDGVAMTSASTLYTVPAGHTFFLTSLVMSAVSVDANLARLRLKDNATVKVPMVAPKNNTGNVFVTLTFAEPIPFTTSVVLDQAGAVLGTNITACCAISGYTQRN